MHNELLELFLKEDCDEYAQRVLLSAINAKWGTSGIEDFTFNRFSIRLDFANRQAVIDDDLNPDSGENAVPLDMFKNCILKNGQP